MCDAGTVWRLKIVTEQGVQRKTATLQASDERAPPSSAGVTARRRASGLSRERIVTESVKYLRRHPNEPLTIARAGAAVGATPMAIYRHFKDGADLAEAIMSEVLDGLGAEIPQDDDWRVQVEAWVRGIYRRLVETPQCAVLLNTSTGLPLGWVRATAALRRILLAAGLRGAALSEAVFWISLTVAGFAQQTLSRPLSQRIEGALAAIASLDPEEAAEISDLTADLPRVFTHGLDILVERTLASVEALQVQPSN
jgi:AcrR family transcriptional regulator